MTQKAAAIEEIFDMLMDSNMFSRMQGDELRAAAPYFGINNYKAGAMIFNEGDKGTFMCIVQKGRVSVVKKDQDGKSVVMGTEGTRGTFGEMALLDGEPRSASCVAQTDCELLTLARTSLDDILKEKPRLGAEILRSIAISLSRRMRASAGRLVDRLDQD
ncbi:MAG: cyclic nucleotide-binding domain-containing protein [Gallionellaceae bacterium]